MQDERKNDRDGKDASAWLESLSEESCVTFAMLADSGAEAIGLTRFLDRENFDVSQMAVKVCSFMQRCEFLFEQRGCLQHSCYTAIMCNHLSKPMTIFQRSAGGVYTTKTLGGRGSITNALLDRCFLRFTNWMKLVKLVVSTEFPEFEAVAAFSALHLTKGQHINSSSVANQLMRLAHLAKVPEDELACQFDDNVDQALFHVSEGKSTVDAWRLALGNASRRDCNDRALREVIMRLIAFGCSTSGVEQLFAKIHATVRPQRGDLSVWHVRDEYDIVGNDLKTLNAPELVMEAAQELVTQCHNHVSFNVNAKAEPQPILDFSRGI